MTSFLGGCLSLIGGTLSRIMSLPVLALLPGMAMFLLLCWLFRFTAKHSKP